MSIRDSLYITLQYLRTVDGEHRYHWGIYATGNEPPIGHLFHATDTGRAALDLYKEIRVVSNPAKSKTMIACLRVSQSPGLKVLMEAASAIRLMDKRYLPRGERQWTCRVWVKEFLRLLHEAGHIRLPSNIDRIEQYCEYNGKRYLPYMGTARVINNLDWIPPPTTPMDIDARPRYWGPSPMETEVHRTGYYGTKPMATDAFTGTFRA